MNWKRDGISLKSKGQHTDISREVKLNLTKLHLVKKCTTAKMLQDQEQYRDQEWLLPWQQDLDQYQD